MTQYVNGRYHLHIYSPFTLKNCSRHAAVLEQTILCGTPSQEQPLVLRNSGIYNWDQSLALRNSGIHSLDQPHSFVELRYLQLGSVCSLEELRYSQLGSVCSLEKLGYSPGGMIVNCLGRCLAGVYT